MRIIERMPNDSERIDIYIYIRILANPLRIFDEIAQKICPLLTWYARWKEIWVRRF